jgi:DNA replicative helicase MCM subunit Mcm2 (Cdc46/Mcm family)
MRMHPEVNPADLEEIYKLVKTTENHLDNEEFGENDSDSLEMANELYNSMLKKLNASEDLLAGPATESFHSELDSVDLSERQLNDESFKLATHAFS